VRNIAFGVESSRLLDDQHTQLRSIAAQKNGRGRTTERAAEDDDIEMLHGPMLTKPSAARPGETGIIQLRIGMLNVEC
jgi:hypothetical protein